MHFHSEADAGKLFRVDKFVVPENAREEFFKAVKVTHNELRKQPGFIRDLVLEQVSGPGNFNIVTFVEWADRSALEAAVTAIKEFHGEIGFDGKALVERLGISADIANYMPVGAAE